MKGRTMKYTKKVLLPITVTYGDYCWDQKRICSHFNNEGGHQTCDLGLDSKTDLKYDSSKGTVSKPDYCKNLKEVEP